MSDLSIRLPTIIVSLALIVAGLTMGMFGLGNNTDTQSVETEASGPVIATSAVPEGPITTAVQTTVTTSIPEESETTLTTAAAFPSSSGDDGAEEEDPSDGGDEKEEPEDLERKCGDLPGVPLVNGDVTWGYEFTNPTNNDGALIVALYDDDSYIGALLEQFRELCNDSGIGYRQLLVASSQDLASIKAVLDSSPAPRLLFGGDSDEIDYLSAACIDFAGALDALVLSYSMVPDDPAPTCKTPVRVFMSVPGEDREAVGKDAGDWLGCADCGPDLLGGPQSQKFLVTFVLGKLDEKQEDETESGAESSGEVTPPGGGEQNSPPGED